MRVVEIEDVAELMPLSSDASRMSTFSSRPSTEACAGPENGAERRERDIDRFMPARADRAAEPVHDRAHRFAPDVGGDIGERESTT